MSNMVDLYEDYDGFFPADEEHEATLRVSPTVWQRYRAASNKLVDVTEALEKAAQRPVYVTPDQEEAVRAIAKPDAWIIVRDADAVTEMKPHWSAGVEESGAIVALPPPPPTPLPEPEGPLKRPPLGRCEQRKGLPHMVMRYVYTDAASVYFPGRLRVDGLCQCGLRIADVKCPHMKQELNEATHAPQCKMCRQTLVSSAGAIDNRNQSWNGRSPQGAADPNVPLPVPAGAQEAPKDAYRAPGS